jgi:phage terminase Nu1 subunit (DNA packaging protein)
MPRPKLAFTYKDLGVTYGAFKVHRAKGMPMDDLEKAKSWLKTVHTYVEVPGIRKNATKKKEKQLSTLLANNKQKDVKPEHDKQEDFDKPIVVEDIEEMLFGEFDARDTIIKARAHKEVYEAKIARIKMLKEKGDLVKASEFTALWAKRITAIRENIILSPERIFPLLRPYLKDDVQPEVIKAQIRKVNEDLLTTVLKQGA